MIDIFFAVPIYSTELDHDALKPKLLRIFETVEKGVSPQYGNCDLTFLLKESVITIDIKDIILNEFRKYLDELKVKYNKIHLLNDWLVRYGQHQYIDEHAHGTDSFLFSGIYFVQSSGDSPTLDFLTPNPYFEHLYHDSCYNEFGSQISVKPTEGKLLFWPSFLKHFVRANPSVEERIVLAFNIGVEK